MRKYLPTSTITSAPSSQARPSSISVGSTQRQNDEYQGRGISHPKQTSVAKRASLIQHIFDDRPNFNSNGDSNRLRTNLEFARNTSHRVADVSPILACHSTPVAGSRKRHHNDIPADEQLSPIRFRAQLEPEARASANESTRDVTPDTGTPPRFSRHNRLALQQDRSNQSTSPDRTHISQSIFSPASDNNRNILEMHNVSSMSNRQDADPTQRLNLPMTSYTQHSTAESHDNSSLLLRNPRLRRNLSVVRSPSVSGSNNQRVRMRTPQRQQGIQQQNANHAAPVAAEAGGNLVQNPMPINQQPQAQPADLGSVAPLRRRNVRQENERLLNTLLKMLIERIDMLFPLDDTQ